MEWGKASITTWFKSSQNNRKGIYRPGMLKTAIMTNFPLKKQKSQENKSYLKNHQQKKIAVKSHKKK